MKNLTLALLLAAALPLLAQTPCPHPAPTIVAPENGAKGLLSPVTFRWTAVPGANGYNVWTSFNGGDFVSFGNTTATDFQNDIPVNTHVEWYVDANFDGCEVGVSSAHASFDMQTCENPSTTLLSPADDALVTSPVTFSWTDVPEADAYRVWVVRQSDANPDYELVAWTVGTTTTSRLEPGVYAWFVETLYDDCDSSFSDLRMFEIKRNQNCATTAPTILSPANGATVTSPVTLTWTAVPGAIGYEVFAALDDGDFWTVDETTATSTELWLGEGKVAWYVEAQFSGCDDKVSETSTFTIPFDAACDNSTPFPLAPADGETNVRTTVDFLWTPVDGATRYDVWAGVNGEEAHVVGTATTTRLRATVPAGAISWFVEAKFANCPSEVSPETMFEASTNATCKLPAPPEIYVDPAASSGYPYVVIWSPGSGTQSFELQEATKADFSDATTRQTEDIIVFPFHNVTGPTRYYYRVRSLSDCGLGFGPYSDSAAVLILPPDALNANDADIVTKYGEQSLVVQKVHIEGSGAAGKGALASSFTAITDKPWLTVSPSSGTIPPEGLDLTVTADPRDLPVGSNVGTVILNSTASAGNTTVPVSVNLVTPVSPNAGTSPLPNSLIIPAIAHATGANTRFESDVRLANTSAQVMKFLLNFTPTLSDGTKSGTNATIQVDPGETAALNDILKNFYGFAAAGDNVSGVLEIRPLNVTTGAAGATLPTVTFASSRTYATGPDGTYGQYIPAIPFAQFIGRGKILSLQQIAQSAQYRTNLGLVEGAGEAASVLVTVFADDGRSLGAFPIDLKPGEHMQLGNYLAQKGISVTDGRIEVTVTSNTGKVTAYASVLDNKTNDPLLVLPVQAANVSANRYILPGVGDFDIGTAHWKSDVRLFNSGTAPVTATLTYYPQASSDAKSTTVTIDPNTVKALDDAIHSLFGLAQTAGSLVVTTPAASKLVTTARTYTDVSGTYGQFIPGITVADGVGLGDRALQILQVEESERFRTNVGIVELTGKPVTVEISAFTPDSKVAARTQLSLNANEFRQIGHVLLNLGLPTTYNGRVTLKVIGGEGRIGGYGSLIDNRTQDPTYVPAL